MLWHASRADIDRPTIANRTVGDGHHNSGLGLFCATAPMDYIAGFGSFIHQLTISPHAKALNMPIRELASLGYGEDRSWFENEGRRHARKYGLIYLVEASGIVEQAIVLRDDTIVSCRKMKLEEFMEIAIDHSAYMRAAAQRSRGPW